MRDVYIESSIDFNRADLFYNQTLTSDDSNGTSAANYYHELANEAEVSYLAMR